MIQPPVMTEEEKAVARDVAKVSQTYRMVADRLGHCGCGDPNHVCVDELNKLIDLTVETLVPYITDKGNIPKLANTLVPAIVGSFLAAELLTINFHQNKSVPKAEKNALLTAMADHFIDFGTVLKLRTTEDQQALKQFTAEELRAALDNILRGQPGSPRRRSDR